jgi:oxalate decarboxylase/phosphoglucose isomerase-like protein (cupin superfamily)
MGPALDKGLPLLVLAGEKSQMIRLAGDDTVTVYLFNPTMHVRGSRNTGKEPLVVLTMFTPAMKETDGHFLSQ